MNAKRLSTKPPVPGLDFERKAGFPDQLVAGVDEVGRGCLAGPVVAAAVILPRNADPNKQDWLHEVTDSKLLTAAKRERVDPLIREFALSHGIGIASVDEIEEINIYHASHLAMKRAIAHLDPQPHTALVDGKFPPSGLSMKAVPIIKGDMKSLSIACASILAKVWRDRWMAELDQQLPGYGFAAHKGYPTPLHLAALDKLGVSSVHRKTFSPVKELLPN